MKYNISKELFEAVAKIEVDYFKVDNWSVNYNNTYTKINDFFFQCKEFALEQGYAINILYRSNGYNTLTLRYGIDYDYSEEFSKKNNNLQIMFDACQWILDNKDRL